MEKKNSGYLVAIIALAIAVVGMSVGFSFSNIDLTIEGNNVTAKAATWDVHFDPASVNVTTESVEATTVANAIETAYTTATYAVTLTQPGDFYEFTIDAKNYGTFDAKLASYSFSAVSSISTDDPYIKHT